MANGNGEKVSWTEYLRLATPVGIFLIGLLVAGIKADIITVKCDIKEVDAKMFRHLTNDDIHTPKNIVVSQAEFNIYQQMRDRQMTDIKDLVVDLRTLLQRYNENLSRVKNN